MQVELVLPLNGRINGFWYNFGSNILIDSFGKCILTDIHYGKHKIAYFPKEETTFYKNEFYLSNNLSSYVSPEWYELPQNDIDDT